MSMGVSPGRGLRVLMAEDEWLAAEVLAEGLADAGFTVLTARDGLAALELAAGGEPFDLLLTDIVMPEMDGIELAQRCNDASPRTKVMFTTGFAAVTLKASREQPRAKVLSKPFHLKDLVLEVDRMFRPEAAAII